MTGDSSDDNGLWGCIGSILILWGISAFALAVISWILSWPFFLGYILLGMLSAVLVVAIVAYLGDALLRWIWPSQILEASYRASKTLNGSLFRHNGRTLVFKNIEEVDTEERKARASFMELVPGAGLEEKTIGDIYIQPKANYISNRIYSLLNPAQAYRDSLENADFQYIPQESPDGKAWRACVEIFDEAYKLAEERKRAVCHLDDISKVLTMDPANELTSGIRKRAAVAKPRIESIIEKIDIRTDFLSSSAEKLFELISVPPSLRALGAGDELEVNIVDCKGSADDLVEEVRLFEESYSSLLDP